MRSPCRRHRPADVLPRYLFCPEDALDVLWAVEAEHPDAQVLALVVDRDRRGVLAMPVTGDGVEPHPTIEPVAESLARALAGNPDGPMGLVLCTVRRGQGVDSAPADAGEWDRTRARCQDAGIELLDWFLFDPPDSRSMAETYDTGWPDPPVLA